MFKKAAISDHRNNRLLHKKTIVCCSSSLMQWPLNGDCTVFTVINSQIMPVHCKMSLDQRYKEVVSDFFCCCLAQGSKTGEQKQKDRIKNTKNIKKCCRRDLSNDEELLLQQVVPESQPGNH